MDAACRPIIFIDSGIGGLPYLEQTRKTLPKENYIYVADTTAFPYGEKSQEDLKKIVVERVSILIERFLPKTLVVACNTASVVALSTLRSHFDIPFVGVEPYLNIINHDYNISRLQSRPFHHTFLYHSNTRFIFVYQRTDTCSIDTRNS